MNQKKNELIIKNMKKILIILIIKNQIMDERK